MPSPPVANTVLAAAFWLCTAGILYTYALYPILIHLLSRLFGRPQTPPVDTPFPRVALLIAAHNEAAILDHRIRNALALDYPTDKLEIVIASDGSSDDTADICRRFESRIRPLLFQTRRGKSATLNAAMERLDADIVVLSDANTFMEPQSLRRLVRWFADDSVGSVCGRLILTDPDTGRNADGLYWRYETWLKTREARLNGLLGANGAIYAIRRALFRPLPAGTVVDDFVIPLSAKLRSGCRIIYDAEAIAHEETAPDVRAEFGRRARIGVGGWQALGLLWPLLSPHHGWTALTFWSHKVLRWVCPFFMFGALAVAAILARQPLYRAALIAQLAFYAICAAAAFSTPAHKLSRITRLCSMFLAMNLALLVGFFRWLRGNTTGLWHRTPRGARHEPT